MPREMLSADGCFFWKKTKREAFVHEFGNSQFLKSTFGHSFEQIQVFEKCDLWQNLCLKLPLLTNPRLKTSRLKTDKLWMHPVLKKSITNHLNWENHFWKIASDKFHVWKPCVGNTHNILQLVCAGPNYIFFIGLNSWLVVFAPGAGISLLSICI